MASYNNDKTTKGNKMKQLQYTHSENLEVDLTTLGCVRSLRICYSEATEKCPTPDKTTSLKLYKDGDKVYVAGGYQGKGSFACKAGERNLRLSLQTIGDNKTNRVTPVIEQSTGSAGGYEFSCIQRDILKMSNIEVCKGVGDNNKSLVNKLHKVKELMGKDSLIILYDTFKRDCEVLLQLSEMLGKLICQEELKYVHQDYGALYALATGVNYLFKPKVPKYKISLDFSEALDKLKEFKGVVQEIDLEETAYELTDKAIDDDIVIPVDSETFNKLSTLASKGKGVYCSEGVPLRKRTSEPLKRVLEYQGLVFLEEELPEPIQEPSKEYEIHFLGDTCNKKAPVLRLPSGLLYTALLQPNSEENKYLRSLTKR